MTFPPDGWKYPPHLWGYPPILWRHPNRYGKGRTLLRNAAAHGLYAPAEPRGIPADLVLEIEAVMGAAERREAAGPNPLTDDEIMEWAVRLAADAMPPAGYGDL